MLDIEYYNINNKYIYIRIFSLKEEVIVNC